ncbi:anti-sigma factor family protein [Nocardioides sp. CPCC 206347]|uniref:anti-sigma factor family protein n=1 Tax=Nocardioides sp. CPCC 206347 TaxID=3406463 RepID=UPI003B437C1B
MIGHLGNRVSALLDGQLSAKDTEEAWAHVYSCHACRDLVEREGWVKTRLAGLCGGERMAPSDLKGSLLSMPPGDALLAGGGHGQRRGAGVAMIGGGALGAAMLGVLAFGLNPGGVPPTDRRPPTTQIDSVLPSTPTPTPATTPVAGNGASTVSTTLTTVLRMPVRGMLP